MKKKARASASKGATKRSPRKASRSSRPKHTPTPGLYGWITHTELASSDPEATKAWCANVLGWTFNPPMKMPDGTEYHLFHFSDTGGGGVRKTAAFEAPHSTFTVHVADAQAAFEKAIGASAKAIQQPTRVMEGVTIAVVREPGGVQVGLSGP